jgi:hypothetical protein
MLGRGLPGDRVPEGVNVAVVSGSNPVATDVTSPTTPAVAHAIPLAV